MTYLDILFILLSIYVIHLFFMQRAALELSRELGYEVRPLVLPSSFFIQGNLFPLALLILLGIIGYKESWITALCLGAGFSIVMIACPIPQRYYTKARNKLKAIEAELNEVKFDKPKNVHKEENPHAKYKSKPNKRKPFETFLIRAITDVNEPGIKNLEEWFKDDEGLRKHYIKEYVYLKYYLICLVIYYGNGKYDYLQSKDSIDVFVRGVRDAYQHPYFVKYGVDISESVETAKFYKAQLAGKDLEKNLPLVFEDAIGPKYMKSALMDPDNLVDLVNAACKSVDGYVKKYIELYE